MVNKKVTLLPQPQISAPNWRR